MDRELLRKGVRLYYRILTLHRQKLPPAMRKIGDVYVQQQFRQHHRDPTFVYYSKFYNEWEQYCKSLEGQGVLGVSQNMVDVENKLSTQQQEYMAKIKNEVLKK